MNEQLDGATVLISGGATGLGAAVAELAAGGGARVAVLDTHQDEGEKTARRVGGHFWRLDVASADQWPLVVADVEDRLGPIRFAFLNAGIMTQRLDLDARAIEFESTDVGRYRQVVAANVDGVVFGLLTLLPRLRARGGGGITVTSSAAGLIPIPFDPIYSLTKHALVGLVRSLALAYVNETVRINAICPGGFASPLFPPELRAPTTMTAREMAEEAIDLLLRGKMGEIRVKLQAGVPSAAWPPPSIALG